MLRAALGAKRNDNAQLCASRFYAGIAAGASPRHVGNDAWLHSIVACRDAPLLGALWSQCFYPGRPLERVTLRRTPALPHGVRLRVRAASLLVTVERRRVAVVSKTFLDEFHLLWSADALALTADALAGTHGTLRCRVLALFTGGGGGGGGAA